MPAGRPTEFAAVLRERAARAAKQAARKDAKSKLDAHKDQVYMYRMSSKLFNKARYAIYADARRNAHQDWSVGPRLMPRHDVGVKREGYGSLDQQLVYEPVQPEKWRSGQTAPFAVGDRVAILSGPDKGKIDTVTAIQEERQTVQLENLHKMLIKYPKFMAEEYNMPTTLTTNPRELKWTDARLVHRMTSGPRAGQSVVVEELLFKRDAETGKMRRYIRGPRTIESSSPSTFTTSTSDSTPAANGKRKARTARSLSRATASPPSSTSSLSPSPSPSAIQAIDSSILEEIPWPPESPEEASELTVDDTQEDLVDIRTFTPSPVQIAPFPPSVIDELRDKYAPDRQRHDPEWLAVKEKEFAERRRAEERMRVRAAEIVAGQGGGRRSRSITTKTTTTSTTKVKEADATMHLTNEQVETVARLVLKARAERNAPRARQA